MAEKLSYEQSVELAKEKLKELSNAEIPLDQATKLYKEGMGLIEEANKMLENAKLEYEEHQAKNA